MLELGEVEAVLTGLPELREAVVLAREDEVPGRKVLVAYVMPVGENERLVQELRVALHDKLPRYMHPAVIIELDAFPLTRGSKIDRPALPAPERQPRIVDTDYEAPRTPLVGLLADLLADALALPEVGVHDDFFELGGDSLVATNLLAQIHSVLSVELRAALFFENATVAGLAEMVESHSPGLAGASSHAGAESSQAAALRS